VTKLRYERQIGDAPGGWRTPYGEKPTTGFELLKKLRYEEELCRLAARSEIQI
jgi:hypothetical protein